MNSLTKVLLEDLLDADNKKVTAIYGGGFKPPTKGHFDVVAKASEQNPEIDDILIYVGGGERNGISQGESIQIWELYKKYLPIKTVIEPVNAPIGSILRYAKEHPEEKILWIIGARENNPEDFADIASRTRTLEKYPNLQLRVIQTSGGVSGTAARNAVKDNNKTQFFHLIPDIPEKEQVWDIVSPVVKEEKINEIVTGTEVICDNCDWEWKIADGGDDLYICHKCGHDNNPDLEEGTCSYDTDVKTGEKLNTPGGLKEEINPSTKLKSNIINEGRYDSISRQLASYTLKGWKDDFEHNEPTGRVEFAVGPDGDLEYEDLKFSYKGVAVFAGIQTYSYNGSARLTSGEIKITYSIPKSMLPQGWEKIYMDLISVIRHEIEHLTQGGINVKPGKEILDLPLRRLVIKYPDTLRYILLPSEKDANVQGLYLKAKKARRPYAEVVDEYIRDLLKITNKNDVDILKGMYDKRAKELNLPAILENDFFGLNKLSRQFIKEALIETWNPKESFVSLSKYMIDNGMNIKPLPKIKIISNDEENASNLLGKTAYYNPNDKSITLYTKDRHPKDICRSFTHEMVHHEQNLEGRLNNINTTNTNEDGALPEIEKEAYEKGNMMLRNWEDSIKNV